MALCLKLAARGRGAVSPNPVVGCVIVRAGRRLAEGYHQRFGEGHAEINALKKINFAAKGATLYCNLEPCCHRGKTPACLPQVINSGVKRVVIACQDPNPAVQGRSIKALRRAGIEVVVGVGEAAAKELNRGFFTWVTKQRPYIIIKIAQSLDGRIAHLRKGRERIKWITGGRARRRVHQLRSEVDAVLVGSGTMLQDRALLNVRGIRGAAQPIRVILDRRGRVPQSAPILKSRGGPVWVIRDFKELADRGITSVMIEGGGGVFRSFLQAQLFDEIIVFLAPQVLGVQGLELGPVLKQVLETSQVIFERYERHGGDLALYFRSR